MTTRVAICRANLLFSDRTEVGVCGAMEDEKCSFQRAVASKQKLASAVMEQYDYTCCELQSKDAVQ